MASVSSCVPEVAIRHFCVANLSQPENRLPSQDKNGAHRDLATLARRHKGHGRWPHT
jgi:hypothetical protein